MSEWQELRSKQRIEMLACREEVSKNNRYCWSSAITATLKKGFPVLQRSAVGFYWPRCGEYDPRPAIKFFQEKGAIIALPEIENKREPLRFRKWWPTAPMKVDIYGIPVPDKTELIAVDAIIIPMVGFDKQGYRLGYGGGYFDRTLAVIKPTPLTIGVAFEISRLNSIAPQSHDIRVSFIVTEMGIYRVLMGSTTLISNEECAAENPLR